jgi:glycosyltransferase involved in cell wall biosynthesis
MNKFLIICPLYNVETTIQKTINSILLQDYKNYKCIIVNDNSTDKTIEIINKVIYNNSNFILVNNKERKYSLSNIYNSIHHYSKEEEEIVIILDGDDFFASKDVLSYLNEYYLTNKCWLTYGSYVNLSNMKKGAFSKQIPSYVIENNLFRNHEWCTSHMRTFKSFLFKSIKKESLCDTEGNFYKITGDLAIMFPMLEMAYDKSRYIDKVLYIWNDLNELNDHKKDNRLQIKTEIQLRNLPKYNRIQR